MEIKICHLYPDTLNLYGDGGNITCLKRRLEWRGIGVSVTPINIGDTLNADDYDIFFIGGGQDFEQSVMLRDLDKNNKGNAIIEAVEKDKPFLAICGGYQLLGKSYTTWDNKRMDFLGAINVETIGEKKRLIGNFSYKLSEEDGGSVVVGFENHSGLTYLGEGVKPLGTIISGNGNNGKDGTEGARYRNVFATYSHGPVLPKNPKFADLIIEKALLIKYGEASLTTLDDGMEMTAHNYMEKRLSGE